MKKQVDNTFLSSKGSYQFNVNNLNDRRIKISPQKFFCWQKDHMYKSAYNQNHSTNDNSPKNTAIPGYAGFIPKVRADSLYAKTKTSLAQSCLVSQNLDINRSGLASTGFNLTQDALIDKSKLASSSKYGKTEIQRAHPNWNQQWKTTNQLVYENPSKVKNPLFKDTQTVGRKPQNLTSGYSQNHAYLDGNGWKPHEILNAENKASEYRNIYNPQQSFHRDTYVARQRRMSKPQMNYSFNF